jgi:hypothetical protein
MEVKWAHGASSAMNEYLPWATCFVWGAWGFNEYLPCEMYLPSGVSWAMAAVAHLASGGKREARLVHEHFDNTLPQARTHQDHAVHPMACDGQTFIFEVDESRSARAVQVILFACVAKDNFSSIFERFACKMLHHSFPSINAVGPATS